MNELIARIIEVLLSPQRLLLLSVVLVVTAAVVISRRKEVVRRESISGVLTDVIYASIYVGGVYGFLLIGPLNRGLERFFGAFLPLLETKFIEGFPFLLQFVIALVVIDGCGYFAHRLAHREPLWSFHSVHHSQKTLTPLTNYRLHLIDVALFTIARGIGAFFLGLYGMEQRALLPAAVLLPALELLAHSGLRWDYGAIGRVLVSPRFHGVHHSRAEEDFDRNFGMTFSFWDDLFGTASRGRIADEYGVDDPAVPENFFHQLYWPFIRMLRRSSNERAPSVDGVDGRGI